MNGDKKLWIHQFIMDYYVKIRKNRKLGLPKDQTKLIRGWLWLVVLEGGRNPSAIKQC